MKKDIMSVLPDGSEFVSWEMPCSYDMVIHVNPAHKMSADNNDGSSEAPLKTISEAARRAVAGTKVVIHQGTYRECVRPQAGGEGPEKMVLYEAAGDGDVVIKASEEVTEFEKSTGWIMGEIEGEEKTPIIWCHHLNPEQFKGYNPFCAVNILHDRLFIEYDKTDMTPYLNRRGMVFCDGKPLVQVALYRQMTEQPGSYWVEANGQTIHFRLENDEDPRMHTIELTCREQCFAPEIPFLSYIHVKGITCAHAAMGAPVPQRGALSCMRGHHWIIENCTIDWSNAVGIDIGNECWHHEMIPGQKQTYDSSSSRAQLAETNGESEIAWKDGKIVFHATPLPEALRMLEKRFNVTFVLSNDRLRGEAFTGSFSHQRLERILEKFKISSNFNWRYLESHNIENEKAKVEIY